MKKFDELVKIVARLRKECPWDREQTLESLKPFLLEEVQEAIEAIDGNDPALLAEELGDMLLHVVMLGIMLKENTNHSIETIINGLIRKMIHRHPHVFGTHKASTSAEVLKLWKKQKQKEAKRKARKPREK